jgi:hypothetical protein
LGAVHQIWSLWPKRDAPASAKHNITSLTAIGVSKAKRANASWAWNVILFQIIVIADLWANNSVYVEQMVEVEWCKILNQRLHFPFSLQNQQRFNLCVTKSENWSFKFDIWKKGALSTAISHPHLLGIVQVSILRR